MEINVWMRWFVQVVSSVLNLFASSSAAQNPLSGGELPAVRGKDAISISTLKNATTPARIRVQRKMTAGISLSGDMVCDEKLFCYTMERVGVQIPAGIYSIELTYSPHFQREMPLVDSVPNRTAIRVHPGNCPQDSDGCILVGKEYTVDRSALVDSREASDNFNAFLGQLLKEGPQMIEIVDADKPQN